jgi:hypothetical protein
MAHIITMALASRQQPPYHPRMTKKKVGRPALAVKKPYVVYFRITTEERAELDAAVKRSGARRFSDWARQGLLRLARSQP